MLSSVILLMKNRSSEVEHRVSVILRVEVVLYTGRVGDPIKKSEVQRLVKPGDVEEVKLEISWEEYGSRLLNQCAFNIACLATVEDTNFEYFAQDDFRVRKPDIKIKVRSLRGCNYFYCKFLDHAKNVSSCFSSSEYDNLHLGKI